MYCTKCGAELREGAAFCPQCGGRVAGVRPAAVRPETAEGSAAVSAASAQPRKRSHLAISIVAALVAVAFVAAVAIVALDDLAGGAATSSDVATEEDEASVDLVLVECSNGTTNIHFRFDCTQVTYAGGYCGGTLEAGGAIFWDFDGYETWLVYRESSSFILLADEEEDAFYRAMDGETVDGVEFTTFDEFIEEHPELTS